MEPGTNLVYVKHSYYNLPLAGYCVYMKIEKIQISGYRGFNDFKITSSDTTNLTVLAGQNGTGKSTILEVVAFLLNSRDRGQIIDPNTVHGITAEEMKWEIAVSISGDEIEYIAGSISEKNPYYAKSRKEVEKIIRKDLAKKNGRFTFSIKLSVKRSELRLDSWFNTVTPEFFGADKKKRDLPRWLVYLQENQIFFVDYVKPFEGIGEPGSTSFSSSHFDAESLKFNNTQIDLRNRGTRTTINVGLLLNKAATNDIWKIFKDNKGKFITLQQTLDEINKIIDPIRIEFDYELAENGFLQFHMNNTKTGKTYPLQFASSGEKQIIGLVSILLNWLQQPLKKILVLDEPDVHLHPEYVTRFAHFINSIFHSQNDFSCLIATHSPEFIAENADAVYQIASDSKSIFKVENLMARSALLGSLGKKFDLAYLCPKVIFVEGVEWNKNRPEDSVVYQKLVDPSIKKVKFLAAGSKKEAEVAKEFTDLFFEKISNLNSTLNIFALVDKDNSASVSGKTVLVTPYNCLENLFVMDSLAVSEAASFFGSKKWTSTDIEEEIKKLLPQGKDLISCDGKEIMKSLYNNLRKKDKEMICGDRAFLFKVFENLRKERLPKPVQKFLETLKND